MRIYILASLKSFAWILMGNVSYTFSLWLLLIILIKIEGEYAAGQLALIIALTTPIFMLMNLQLRVILGTDSKDSIPYGVYVTIRIFTSIVAIAVVATIVLLQGYDIIFLYMFIIWSLGKAFESLSDLGYGLLQRADQMNMIGISQLIKATLFVVLFWLTLSSTNNILLGLCSLTLVWVIVYVLFDLRNFSRISSNVPLFQWDKILKLFKLGIPMGVVMGIISLTANVPRYFLEDYYNLLFVGYFSSVYYLKVVGSTLVNALGQASVSKLALLFSINELKAFSRRLLILLMIGVLLGLIGIALAIEWGDQILKLLYSEQYGQFEMLFIILMVAGAIEYLASILGYGITATRSFKVQPYIFSVVLITAIMSCIWFIPTYGMNGAGYAAVLASSVQLILSLSVMLYILLNARIPGESE